VAGPDAVRAVRPSIHAEWQPKLQRIAARHGVELFSSAFDESAVDFLESMRVPAYKVASF
jgi:sialic acid synthase SpsE